MIKDYLTKEPVFEGPYDARTHGYGDMIPPLSSDGIVQRAEAIALFVVVIEAGSREVEKRADRRRAEDRS